MCSYIYWSDRKFYCIQYKELRIECQIFLESGLSRQFYTGLSNLFSQIIKCVYNRKVNVQILCASTFFYHYSGEVSMGIFHHPKELLFIIFNFIDIRLFSGTLNIPSINIHATLQTILLTLERLLIVGFSATVWTALVNLSNLFSFGCFFIRENKKKLQGARSGLHGKWGKSSTRSLWRYSVMIVALCVAALSWWSMTSRTVVLSFLLEAQLTMQNVGHFFTRNTGFVG